MSDKEISCTHILRIELTTEIGLSQTTPDLNPIIITSYMIPKPIREPIKAVLFVSTAGYPEGSIGSGYDKGEDEEDKEESDEDGHTAKVEGKKALFVPVGPNETQ